MPKKLMAKFSTRSRRLDLDRSGVVYRFRCSQPACSAAYVGHTLQTLSNRIKQHRRVESSIFQHFSLDHDVNVPPFNELKACFDILYSSNDSICIKIVESLRIKFDRPYINVKYNEMNGICRLF